MKGVFDISYMSPTCHFEARLLSRFYAVLVACFVRSFVVILNDQCHLVLQASRHGWLTKQSMKASAADVKVDRTSKESLD